MLFQVLAQSASVGHRPMFAPAVAKRGDHIPGIQLLSELCPKTGCLKWLTPTSKVPSNIARGQDLVLPIVVFLLPERGFSVESSILLQGGDDLGLREPRTDFVNRGAEWFCAHLSPNEKEISHGRVSWQAC